MTNNTGMNSPNKAYINNKIKLSFTAGVKSANGKSLPQ